MERVDIWSGKFRLRQWAVSELVVDAMVEGLNAGHELPEIEVDRLKDGTYGICNGNHRFFAHRKSGRSDIFIKDAPGWFCSNNYDFSENEIKIIPGRLESEDYKLISILSRLPYSVAENFCDKHGLDVDYYRVS